MSKSVFLLDESFEKPLLRCAWVVVDDGCSAPPLAWATLGEASQCIGVGGRSFPSSAWLRFLPFVGFSEPEAGGVGGSLRCGGGEGKGGASSSCGSGAGLLALVDACDRLKLFLFIAFRGSDADLGRGVYDFPSLTTNLAGFCWLFAFGTGISSATNMTGLSTILASFAALPLEAVGEMGAYPVALIGVVSDGTAETGVRVNSVIFFQPVLLDAVDEDLVFKGAGRRSGMEICGLAFFKRCRGPRGETLARLSIALVATGLSRSFRALLRSSRSFRDIG